MSNYLTGFSSTFTPTGGYTCYRCKAFVPNGCTHSCPTMVWVNPTPPVTVTPTAEDRIAAALERIAVALERLSKEEP